MTNQTVDADKLQEVLDRYKDRTASAGAAVEFYVAVKSLLPAPLMSEVLWNNEAHFGAVVESIITSSRYIMLSTSPVLRDHIIVKSELTGSILGKSRSTLRLTGEKYELVKQASSRETVYDDNGEPLPYSASGAYIDKDEDYWVQEDGYWGWGANIEIAKSGAQKKLRKHPFGDSAPYRAVEL